MGYFYFDDSIHKRGGFALGALVYANNSVENMMVQAFKSAGLTIGIHEFKSHILMDKNPAMTTLRTNLKNIFLKTCRLAVTVVPYLERKRLGNEGLFCLAKVLKMNGLEKGTHEVYFDEGLFRNKKEALRQSEKIMLNKYCNLHFEQDSIKVHGLQLADLAAHTSSVMLLETLGVIKKTIKAGEGSGYDPEMDIELGFEMWAGVRYCFFHGGTPRLDITKEDFVAEDFVANVADYGLQIASSCDDRLRKNIENRFGTVYLGCIH